MKRLVIPAIFGILLVTAAWSEFGEDSWPQWAQNPQHTGFVSIEGQSPKKQLADIVYDPFVAQEQTEANGELLVHFRSAVDFSATSAWTATALPPFLMISEATRYAPSLLEA